MALEHPYEPRESTETAADKIINVLGYSKVALVNVGTGGGKTFMSIRAVAKRLPKVHLLVLTTKKQVDANHWNDSIDSYNEVMKSDITYTITNYERARSKGHYPKLVQKLQSINDRPVVMILDECQRIKGYTSTSTSKMVIAISRMNNVLCTIGLSATLASNSILDACNYLILAGYYTSKTQFLRIHAKYQDDHFQPIVKDYDGNISPAMINQYEELVNKINNITITIDTEDKVPPRKAWQEIFTYPKKVQKEYRKIIKDYKEGVYDSVNAALMAEREFVATHSEDKNEYVKKLINDPNRPNTPVLIFYQYTIERETLLSYIEHNLPDYEIIIIAGSMKKKVSMNKPKNPKTIFLIQYRAGGEGLNAPWSRLTIFYTPTNSYQDFKQAQGRNRRAGSTEMVYQVRLVVDKTVNAHMWFEIIDNKQNFSKQLQAELVDKE